MLPIQAHFSPRDQIVFLEVMDLHGYWQVTTFNLVSGVESRFSSGWLDHYGHVLSKNGRFLAYRQGELPSEEEREGDGKRSETLYYFDLHNDEGRRIADRAMRAGSQFAGPALSGDLRHLYYVKDGWVCQCALPE